VRVQQEETWTCLGCKYELVSDASFLGPLSNEFFRCFVLAGVEYELVRCKVESHDPKSVLSIRGVDKVSLYRQVLAENKRFLV
jgi:hypothetical protein